MPSATSRRGRPRGSGLDDRAQLRRIVDMLEADPSLKPTTAIKAIGVSDPSTIRRLRDKLKAGVPQKPPSARGGAAGRPAARLEARRAQAPARPMPERPAQTAGLAEISPASFVEAQAHWFVHWYALGLSALSSTVEAQMALMDDLLQVPQVESALRQQLLFNEVAKAFCPRRPDVRATLH